jgi:stage V sporulation protein SpoVS
MGQYTQQNKKMPLPNWGNLEKSLTDPEKIEEAIARMIREHNEDETAHLGPGQSLQSHKASEIIDHLALSIVADKIKDLQVTTKKININSLYSQIQLESLDAWIKTLTGTGASANLDGVGVVSLVPGNEAGSLAILSTINPLIAAYSEKDPFIQILVADGGDEVCDIALSYGMENPFNNNQYGFGIEYSVADNKVYGFYNNYYNGAWHRVRVELETGAPYNKIWRAEFYHTEKVIKFYINNNLIETADFSAHEFIWDSDYFIAFGAKKHRTYSDAAVWFMNPIFNQNIE